MLRGQGAGAFIWLSSGDAAKGGNIDLHLHLHLQFQGSVDHPICEASLLSAQLQRHLNGRKVDVRLLGGQQARLTVDDVALAESVLLTSAQQRRETASRRRLLKPGALRSSSTWRRPASVL